MQNSKQISGAAHAIRVSSMDERSAALEFLAGLAADLSRGPVDLPCFPNVVIKIRDALNDPNTTIEETVRLVGTEPRLTASLMQTANSAALNHSGKRITELKLAITRLGQQLVQGATMAFAVRQMKDPFEDHRDGDQGRAAVPGHGIEDDLRIGALAQDHRRRES